MKNNSTGRSRLIAFAKLIKKGAGASDSSRKNPDDLFEGDDALFKSIAAKSVTYFEYGCGASTVWMAKNSGANIHATDTSSAWLDKVRQRVPAEATDRLHLNHIDLGPLKAWGRPSTYDHRARFSDYASQMWSQGNADPDVVLVDGRFRVCCFLTSLRNARPGTHLFFDDYMNRPHYHVVEEFVQRADTCGRQGLFIVPEKSTLDIERLDAEIAAFRYVMD
ncbi:hypothetical protein [Aliiroseovarius sp. S253]|uniref:hypothetical protein n=1 Tax=Aliiroseovarius sp. S253 TaxID=3415133 RepID=UPI003C7D44E5